MPPGFGFNVLSCEEFSTSLFSASSPPPNNNLERWATGYTVLRLTFTVNMKGSRYVDDVIKETMISLNLSFKKSNQTHSYPLQMIPIKVFLKYISFIVLDPKQREQFHKCIQLESSLQVAKDNLVGTTVEIADGSQRLSWNLFLISFSIGRPLLYPF